MSASMDGISSNLSNYSAYSFDPKKADDIQAPDLLNEKAKTGQVTASKLLAVNVVKDFSELYKT
jgi:hypothetical protein